MAFDQATRNRLQRFVGDARKLLTEEFTRQLQNDYGLDPTGGAIQPLESLTHLDDAQRETGRLLREMVAHYQATSPSGGAATALERIVREQAFTVLNRLAALRMAEARGLLIESVGNGYQSRGFQLYARLAGSGLGETGDAYRCYLFSVFDELALDLAVLFDRFSPQGRLFPRDAALRGLLELLNDPELADLWAEDETIGWIYQYFNSKEERKKMRDESAAPRNSRELAVRNQFFTPRYVVEFLTDNTLGRTWYEMTQGESALTNTCRYLVRRPSENFLTPGETAPTSQGDAENRSQEELAKQPVYIPHRPLKDPREILMLDPACGSMHFGLYAFDLYETIYAEAWGLEEQGKALLRTEPMLKSLHETYDDDREAFLRDVPRLILERNIHGVDIDPRAVQIAGLSLWLRAQRAWQEQGVRPGDRPQVRRSNIVCAEPMPGEEDLRAEFLRGLDLPIAELTESAFEKMRLADTLGTLLRIEDDLSESIAIARETWVRLQKPLVSAERLSVQMTLDPEDRSPVVVQQSLSLEALETINDASFFRRAETNVLHALRAYAERAEDDGPGLSRRLFADDAARGFAFIDLCRKRFDVVVMNPPFGDAALPSRSYLEETYGDTKGDVYKAFVECFQDRLVPGGFLGAITSRTGFFLGQSADWRERVLLRLYRPLLLADLGAGVLDAMVETAAFVLRSLTEDERRALTVGLAARLGAVKPDKNGRFTRAGYQKAFGLKRHQAEQELAWLAAADFVSRTAGEVSPTTGRTGPERFKVAGKAVRDAGCAEALPSVNLTCLRLLAGRNNDAKREAMNAVLADPTDGRRFVVDPSTFSVLPEGPFVYWLPPTTRRKLRQEKQLEPSLAVLRQGLGTGDNERFVRAVWEVPPHLIAGAPAQTPEEVRGLFDTGKRWAFHVRSGDSQPWYSPLTVVIDWENQGERLKEHWRSKGESPSRYIPSENLYFRPGFSWTRRAFRLIPYIIPAGCIPSASRYMGFPNEGREYEALAACASNVATAFSRFYGEMFARPNHLVDTVKKIPVVELPVDKKAALSKEVRTDIERRRNFYRNHEPFPEFTVPALVEQWTKPEEFEWNPESLLGQTSDDAYAAAFGLCHEEFESVNRDLQEAIQIRRKDIPTQGAADEADEAIEDQEGEAAGEGDDTKVDISRRGQLIDLLSYCVGVAFGRWDVRLATGEHPMPTLSDPFAPLPVCSPGMLQNAHGLPAEPNDVPADYPFRISWSSILVDDPGQLEDIERRVRDVLEVLWNTQAEAIEQEACEILGIKTLRGHFRKPAGFFADHLKRYSKSRRQAPIYWPLSTEKGSYTLWLYYHRLTDQTLYTCGNDFVGPKLAEVEAAANALRGKSARSRDDERELERLQDLEAELRGFRDELLRLAPVWKPNLNDGVQITAAPLWRLFRLPKWQKTLKETWGKLEKGDYDWAHLAYALWPERVRDKCKSDRSLAIAHGLEDLYEAPPAAPKKTRGGKTAAVETAEEEELAS